MKVAFAALFSSFLLPLTTVAEEPAHPATDDASFTTIFDGTDLSQIETEGNWEIQDDGSLQLTPRPGEEGWKRYGSYLWLKEDYADFVFDFEFKHGEGGNSGFYFRCADAVDPTASGFEVQLLDCFGKEKLGKHDLGGVIRTAPPLKNMSKKPGEWNRMTVTLKGNRLTVLLNGELVQDRLNLAKSKPKGKALAPSGRICIQDHGQPFTVRNLRVKRP